MSNEQKRARGMEIRRALWGDEHAKRLALVRRLEPELADLVLREGFGGIYADERLTLEQRSLVTLSTLVTQGKPRQLESHIRAALHQGIPAKTISAVFVHLFLYVGMPSVIEALTVLSAVLEDVGAAEKR
jgi:4-carboxymuconolactone decarboxylase